jgi:cysteine-rich secretory family protein
MIRTLAASLVIALATCSSTFRISTVQAAEPTALTADSQPSPQHSLYSDAEAGRRLLEIANQDRAKAGLPPLKMDDGLAKAALAHAAAMAAQRKLSHQLSGEPDVEHRLAANTNVHLDKLGENVANLLNAGYNVAGFSVVRSGSLLFVAQDFGHSLPSYSSHEAESLVADSVDRLRAQHHLPQLQLLSGSSAHAQACDMAKAGSLRSAPLAGRLILRYTTSQPQTVPENVARATNNPSIRAFAVGSCYARSASYPTGVYWVVLAFN